MGNAHILSKREGIGFDFCAFMDYDDNTDVQLYEIGNFNCTPYYSYGPIVRPRGIIHYVSKGKGTLFLNDKKFTAGAGDIFYIPAGISSYYEADAKDPWCYGWIHFGGAAFLSVLNDIGLTADNPVLRILPPQKDGRSDFKTLLNDIFTNYENEYFCIAKVYEIMDYFKLTYEKEKETESSRQLKYVHTVIKYIQLHYSEHIKVEAIAYTLNLNRSYLSRLFSDATGMSIQNYITRYRMKASEKMLKNPDNTIQYIAYAVGYNDIFSFSKAFKKHYKMTPTDYRRTSQASR